MQKNKSTQLNNDANELDDKSFLPYSMWEKAYQNIPSYPIAEKQSINSSLLESDDSNSNYAETNLLSEEIEEAEEVISFKEEPLQFLSHSSWKEIEEDEALLLKNKKEKEKIIRQQKRKKRYAATKKTFLVLLDICVVIVCLAGLYWSLSGFEAAFNRTLEKTNEEPIGYITFKRKSAQRKLSDRVLWDRVKQNSPIYNGDILRTADLSEATLTFLDKNAVYFYEQTLVQVFYSEEDGSAIDFTGGEVVFDSGKATRGMSVRSGDTTIEMAKGALLGAKSPLEEKNGELSTSAKNPMAVQLMSGEANLSVKNATGDSNNVTLVEGKSIKFTDDGNITKIPITPISPMPHAQYLRQKSSDLPIVFEWTGQVQDGESLVLEISKDDDFSSIFFQKDISGAAIDNQYSVNLEDGIWHWRMLHNKTEITNSKLRIVDISDAGLILPQRDEVISYRHITPSIRFLWTDDKYASGWLFEIADNKDMIHPRVVQHPNESSSIVSLLEEGEWFWRVTPQYPSNIIQEVAQKSYISSFTIVKKAELEAPELSLPLDNAHVDLDNEELIQFSWDYDKEAVSYTLLISKTKDLSSPVFTKEVDKNYVAFNNKESNLEAGRWYWAVSKKDSEGTISKQSAVFSFLALHGKFTHNTLSPRDNFVATVENIADLDFSWETNLPYESQLQFSLDADFSTIYYEKECVGTSLHGVELPYGIWYWRVIAKDTENQQEYISDVKKLIVDFTVNATNLISPRQNYELVMDAYTPSLLFSWKEVDFADYYEFKLFYADNLKKPIYENKFVEETSIRLNMHKRDRGDFVWSVRAVSNTAPSLKLLYAPSVTRGFSTRNIEYIDLLSPSSNYEIDGVTALLNPPTLSWDSAEMVNHAKFIVTKENKGLSALDRKQGIRQDEDAIVLYVENPEKTISLPPLEEGTWFWTVLGTATNGMDISAPSPSRIIVAEIPLLQVPQNVLPREKQVFGFDYLSQNSFIDFSWQAVPNADEYHLTITDSKGKEIIHETIIGDPSYRFDDMNLLDRGIFNWALCARRYINDETIQEGHILEQSFEIDFSDIVVPKNKTTGKLYGL